MHIIWDIVWKVLLAAVVGMLLALLLVWWGPPIEGMIFGEQEEYINFNDLIINQEEYFLAGSRSTSSPLQTNNSYLLKLDGDGAKEWSKNFGPLGNNKFYSIINSQEDNLVAVGYQASILKANQPYITKLDRAGNPIWEFEFETDKSGLFYDLIEVNNYYFALGMLNRADDKANQALLVKIDQDGKQLNSKVYQSAKGLKLKSLQEVDQQIVVAGTRWDENYQRQGYFALLEQDLELLAEREVTEADYQIQIEDMVYNNGKLFLAGNARANHLVGHRPTLTSGYLASYNLAGEKIWSSLKQEEQNYYRLEAINISNEQIVSAGRRYEPSLYSRVPFSEEMVQRMIDSPYALAYDLTGEILWEDTYRGQKTGGFYTVNTDLEDRFLLAGQVGKLLDYKQGYLNKIDLEGEALAFPVEGR